MCNTGYLEINVFLGMENRKISKEETKKVVYDRQFFRGYIRALISG